MSKFINTIGAGLVIAAEAIGCGGPGNPETTPKPGETVEHTDAGTKITVQKVRTRTVRRVYEICSPSLKILDESKQFDCPIVVKDLTKKERRKRGKKCIKCAREVTETY